MKSTMPTQLPLQAATWLVGLAMLALVAVVLLGGAVSAVDLPAAQATMSDANLAP